MKKNNATFLMALAVLLLFGVYGFKANNKDVSTDPLPSWNKGAIKNSIIDFVENKAKKIRVEDRLAVFDMDGTIYCEMPLWGEMYAAVYGLHLQSQKNQALLSQPIYQYAEKLMKNPTDTSVRNHWVPVISKMVGTAYRGVDHEEYVDTASSYLGRTRDPKFNRPLNDMFYQPMLELIAYLKKNHFSVYVVSGSVQGVIWSICPKVLDLDRSHLIGSRQQLNVVEPPAAAKYAMLIDTTILQPSNNNKGKAMNIYAQLGKAPVFAFGNTDGDFGMFHYTFTSKHPHVAYLLNHDDDVREYSYPPYHGTSVPAWNDSLVNNNWQRVDMSKEFKTVWPSVKKSGK